MNGFSTRVRAIRPLEGKPWYASPASDSSDVVVDLEDGTGYTIVVETPDQPRRHLENDELEHSAGEPALFVRRADEETVARAIGALSSDLSGYWLRVYGSSPKRGSAGARPAAVGLSVVEPGTGVIEASVEDGRRFSLLACEPAWFERAFARLELEFYFGPPVVFVRRLDRRICGAALADMARFDDRWLCLYDAPGRTLPEVMARFKP